MSTSRRKRDPCARTVVRLPERDLAESILDLAAPLLESLGPARPLDDVRHAIEIAIKLWNAHVAASHLWGEPRPKALSELRKSMCGKQAPPGLADKFELLSAGWRREFTLDPRLVGAWSFEATENGRKLVCETTLPVGVEAEVPPPADKRIAIGGKFLDQVRIRLSPTSYLCFTVADHRGVVSSDGVATIHARMPTVVQLFAEGRLMQVGGVPVDVTIGRRKLGPMVLSEVSCAVSSGHHDLAVLVFRPTNGEAAS